MTTQEARIKAAIAECDRFISIESARSADLRPTETAELLAFYIGHRERLVATLSA